MKPKINTIDRDGPSKYWILLHLMLTQYKTLYYCI